LAHFASTQAKAAKVLLSVSGPSQGRTALRKAAQYFEDEYATSRNSASDGMAKRCRLAAETLDDDQLVSVCKQMSATFAAKASKLTKELF
jgi:Tfp pilus assembly protein PilE